MTLQFLYNLYIKRVIFDLKLLSYWQQVGMHVYISLWSRNPMYLWSYTSVASFSSKRGKLSRLGVYESSSKGRVNISPSYMIQTVTSNNISTHHSWPHLSPWKSNPSTCQPCYRASLQCTTKTILYTPYMIWQVMIL